MIELDQLTPAVFTPLLGEVFNFCGMNVRAELSLKAVSILGHRRSEALRDPFSLVFIGPQALRLPQGIYTVENATLGTMDIFVTQIGDGGKGSEFEAIFT